ncbi:MAG: 4'-phosphopantetheinyl transferase superfamily protein [Ruminococcaceae bacterium]|nr:4'-phosphopantetheinyl transferase superfamily protein [Oscillospiraceae bacterium]
MKIYLKKIKQGENLHAEAHRLLAQVYGKSYTLEYNNKSKPFIKGDADFHFNISHSGEWVCLGVSKNEIGVDIEKHNETRTRLAKRFFSAKEQTKCKTVKDFFDIWTKKEAFIKAVGIGLSYGINTFCCFEKQNGYTIKTLAAPNNYSLSVCEKSDYIEKIDIIYVNC